MNFNLAFPFYRGFREAPARLALKAPGADLTYSKLAATARAIAGAMRGASVGRGSRVGILASRSIEACASVLGACWTGAAYVPISLKIPEERLIAILELAQFDALIADARGAAMLSERALLAAPDLILVPDDSTVGSSNRRAAQNVRTFGSLEPMDESDEPAAVGADDLAYIIFTSGSTGAPKGVMVSAGSVSHFISSVQQLYQLTPEDKIADTTELSFDPSVSNMFMAWNAGASLFVVPPSAAMAPANFIRENQITIWNSVGSVIEILRRVKALKPNSFPSLRYSMFGGEPFPLSSGLAWQQAAPNSVIDNVYGPTEATVWCLSQRLTDPPALTPGRQTLAIGLPFPGMQAAIVDDALNFLAPGEEGELALAGPQLASGYFRAPELTAARFPTIDGTRWYLTGDLARQDSAGRFHHLGRIDNQVKVLGHRIELEEVEAHLSAVCGTAAVAVVAWPIANGSADGIVGFVAGKEIVAVEVREALRKRIASYMVPASIRQIEAIPMTPNGKIDRKALLAILAQ